MPQDTAPKAGQGSPHRLPSGALGPTRSKPHLRPPSHPPRPEQPRVCLSRRPHEAEASWDGEHRRTSLREGEGTQEQEGSDRPGPFPPPPPRQHGGAAGPSPCPQRLPPPSPGEPPARRHPQRGRPAPLSRSPPPPPASRRTHPRRSGAAERPAPPPARSRAGPGRGSSGRRVPPSLGSMSGRAGRTLPADGTSWDRPWRRRDEPREAEASSGPSAAGSRRRRAPPAGSGGRGGRTAAASAGPGPCGGIGGEPSPLRRRGARRESTAPAGGLEGRWGGKAGVPSPLGPGVPGRPVPSRPGLTALRSGRDPWLKIPFFSLFSPTPGARRGPAGAPEPWPSLPCTRSARTPSGSLLKEGFWQQTCGKGSWLLKALQNSKSWGNNAVEYAFSTAEGKRWGAL